MVMPAGSCALASQVEYFGMDNANQPSSDQLHLFDTPVEEAKELGTPTPTFSNYIVYVDESGDHSMVSIDDNYPVFVRCPRSLRLASSS